MSRPRKAALVLLILMSALIGIFLLRPDIILNTLAKSTLSELGYKISSLEVTHLGINSVALDQLVLISAGQRIVLSGLHAQYSINQLLAGTAQSISIGKIKLRVLSNSDSPNNEAYTTLASLLDAFDALPVNDIYFPNIELLDQDGSYQIGLGLQSPPLRIAGEAQFDALQDTVIEFDIQRDSSKNLAVETRTLTTEALFSESEIDLNITENMVTVAATSSLFIGSLPEQLENFIPATVNILTDNLSLQSNFEVQEMFGNLSINQLSLVLNSPSSLLQINQESDLGKNTIQLRLPLKIQGEVAISTGEMQLELDEI